MMAQSDPLCMSECMRSVIGVIWNVRHFAPATIAPVVNPNVKRNRNPDPNPNPNPNPNLIPYTIPRTKKPNHHPHSYSLLSEISSQEQLSPEQMSDHRDL